MGALSCALLSYLLFSLGYLPRYLVLVVVAAGYCIPFAIAREVVAKRMRDFLVKQQELSDKER
jgi:pilus assembly protein TadC